MAQGYGGMFPQSPLSAYLEQRDNNERRGIQQQQGALIEGQTIGLLQKMQQDQQDRKRIDEFRVKMAAADTVEKKLQVAIDYGVPKDIIDAFTRSQDRAASLEATKAQRDVVNELARGRLGVAQRGADYNFGPASPSPAAPASSQFGLTNFTAGMAPGSDMRIPPDVQAARDREASNLNSGLTPSGSGPALPSTSVLPKPTAPAATNTLSQMPPEIASAPPAVQNRWRLQQTKPSIAGAASFTPQALNFVAKQYLSGDRQAVQGFARSATARVALQNEIVDEAARQGLTPEQTAAKMAEFAGTVAGSRTVGQRAANISLAATEAQEMLGIVKETSDKFARTTFVPWNMALRAYESGTGTPEIAEFGAAVNALVNVYARAINPTGVPTVSDKEHARAVLNTVQSPAQVNAVLGIINRELEIAKKAPAQVRQGIRDSIAPQGNQYPTATNAAGERLIFKDGSWQKP